MFPGFLSPLLIPFILAGPLAVTVFILCKKKFSSEAIFCHLCWPCPSLLAGLTNLLFIVNAVAHGVLGLYIFTSLSTSPAFWYAVTLWFTWTLLDMNGFLCFCELGDKWDSGSNRLSWSPFVNQTLKLLVTAAFVNYMYAVSIPQIATLLMIVSAWSVWAWILTVLVLWDRWCACNKWGGFWGGGSRRSHRGRSRSRSRSRSRHNYSD